MRTARFGDFVEITARRDSTGCINDPDHEVHKGDCIGWARRFRQACCEPCWQRWSVENSEADLIEQGYAPCPW